MVVGQGRKLGCDKVTKIRVAICLFNRKDSHGLVKFILDCCCDKKIEVRYNFHPPTYSTFFAYCLNNLFQRGYIATTPRLNPCIPASRLQQSYLCCCQEAPLRPPSKPWISLRTSFDLPITLHSKWTLSVLRHPKYVTKQIQSKNCFTSELQNYEGRIELSSEIFIFFDFFRNGLYVFGAAFFWGLRAGLNKVARKAERVWARARRRRL